MAGLLGMDDDTLAILGGLLSKGMIGRGINGYLENKQRQQLLEQRNRALAANEWDDQDKALAAARKAMKDAERERELEKARGNPDWSKHGPLGTLLPNQKTDYQSAMDMARVLNKPEVMENLLKNNQKEVKSETPVVVNGQVKTLVRYKDGTSELAEYDPAQKVQMINAGNRWEPRQEYAQDLSPVPIGQSHSDRIAAGNLAQRQAEFKAQQAQQGGGPKPQIVDGQFVFPPDAANPQGRAAPIPGFTGKTDPKAAQAKQIPGIVKEANDLLDKATGSYVGTGLDMAAGAVGRATEGAKATAQLRVLSAKLMFSQPRFEGPQGVLDVKLYQQAAGDIADSTKPVEVRKAALSTILGMHEKYGNPQQIGGAPAAPEKQVARTGKRKSDGRTVIEYTDGTREVQ